MSQTIKAAIVGTGFIGPAHLEALRRIPNVEVVALVEDNQELANEKEKQLFHFRPSPFSILYWLMNIEIGIVTVRIGVEIAILLLFWQALNSSLTQKLIRKKRNSNL